MATERERLFGALAAAQGGWLQAQSLPSLNYVCGYCENTVASASGYLWHPPQAGTPASARICPHCRALTMFGRDGAKMPSPPRGRSVEHLPERVAAVYDEARNALSAGAPTAAALLSRTLLMHVACHLGAAEGDSFVAYVDYLETNHHVPPSGKQWLDHVRKQGNLSAHALVIIPEKDATELLTFIEMLLRLVFDFPARVPT